MPMIQPTQIDYVLSTLTAPDSLYFIPSFQRPYAWGGKQIEDLGRDMEKAHRYGDHHYLAALHFVQYQFGNSNHPLTDFAEIARNVCQHALHNDQLVTATGSVNVFAVVDGQQRLTTLFLFAHLLHEHLHRTLPQCNRQLFEVLPLTGTAIPRLILGNQDDHDYMMAIVDHIWSGSAPPASKNQAQKRMCQNFQNMKKWLALPKPSWVDFLRSPDFKVLRVLLEPAVGLAAFMSMNDRGKDLTILEKFKALLMQFVYDSARAKVPGAAVLIGRLHNVFGALYRVLDRCVHIDLLKENTADDELVKLISCYIRLDNDERAIWQGANSAYDEFFREQLQKAIIADIPKIVSPWCDKLDEVANQLSHLVDCIEGRSSCASTPSLQFASFTLQDDYHTTLISLGLQPHLLALLLRFRAQYAVDWHQRFSISARTFSLAAIQNLLDDVQNRANACQPPIPQALLEYIEKLRSIEPIPRPEISMLEVVERLQLINWNLGKRWNKTFRSTALAMNRIANPQDCIQLWFNWATCDDFISNILYSSQDANIRYMLKEMERAHSRKNSFHLAKYPSNITTNNLELEHIFAQNIQSTPSFPGFLTYGIKDSAEYQDKVLWRSGNFTWLSQKGNVALGNAWPDQKAAEYASCVGHPPHSGENVCSDIVITKGVGDILSKCISHKLSFRLYVEARCAELALFALKRFC